MNIVLLTVGKTEASFWKEALAEYQRRLQHYVPFELQALPEVKNTKNLTMSQQKTQEGVLIRKAMQAGDWFVLLDEQGKEYTSMQFAAYLEKKIQIVSRRLVFVIGGPYGFSDEVYQMASERLSLSKMTFSHQMIRPIFVEQLYRAMTILRGEPYHHP
ncbi:putative rRNA large subunit m3Psimethyltransferase RlmH [Tannerella forsythia KS16]|mgnify:FL=1|uniref:Ribosomal RNA large subunit methyltransferase H n=1 Tax=Tannerella forsythia (strain ATCC 43037 / JCM 10827 / CCUG 21028 A / KCTC 5666 / FDC 338) TaxID=203275 RepID=G8UQ64_TANFA|nr:23S rRNA (pseudouridine(1915)-N(3))-methyltransferase RlmH [Tannerella forsythia]AEW19954.1 putative rRNA large subunit m3Psi methyltransferase RlmH [Tannerella forsythia 92A2]BAR52009.1 putative rRNA large subunit m3Psimethyltransferase RlmH [Tannerella forsythia KS16]